MIKINLDEFNKAMNEVVEYTEGFLAGAEAKRNAV